MVKIVLQDGAPFALTEKFSQDPLEEHFARPQFKGGSNENPTLRQFQDQELALNVMRSELITPMRWNTSGKQQARQKLNVNDVRELPKKKR